MTAVLDDLNPRCVAVLDAVAALTKANRYAPSVRGIAAATKFAPSSVQHHITTLVRVGALSRKAHTPRTLVVTARGRAILNDTTRSTP